MTVEHRSNFECGRGWETAVPLHRQQHMLGSRPGPPRSACVSGGCRCHCGPLWTDVVEWTSQQTEQCSRCRRRRSGRSLLLALVVPLIFRLRASIDVLLLLVFTPGTISCERHRPRYRHSSDDAPPSSGPSLSVSSSCPSASPTCVRPPTVPHATLSVHHPRPALPLRLAQHRSLRSLTLVPASPTETGGDREALCARTRTAH